MNLRKLKNASLDELRERAAQRTSAFSERRGWSKLVRLPTDQEFTSCFIVPKTKSNGLIEYFRARTSPEFFKSFDKREETSSEFKSRWPQSTERLVQKADRICEGRFDLLGFVDLTFGDPIDWHFEPTSGKRIPLLHWSKLDYLDANLAGDKKIIWELNRHQYFATLGQAYWLTDNETYARTFVEHLNSWMDQNPPKLGINWVSSLEIAFRSISWIWSLYFFKMSPSLTTEFLVRFFKFLFLSGCHLEKYLSTYFSPNTHLTGEALGLFYIGSLFPEFVDAKRWQTLGQSILLDQLSKQVRADGGYFEQASYYHRYTADFYTHFYLLGTLNSGAEPIVKEKLSLLLDHLMFLTRPDGTTPLVGDDDGGRLLPLDMNPANDFRATLCTGALLLERPDLKFVSKDLAEETFWLLGTESIGKFEKLESKEPSQQSIGFLESGYFVMRDGWSPKSNYLLFDAGVHGSLSCGHAHSDALATEITVQGTPMFVDPGTFTYTGSREMRDWFRSTMAHNTVSVDGLSSSVPDGPFSWKQCASAKVSTWLAENRFDYVVGEHDGYQRLPQPVKHERRILFLKHDYWLIHDLLTSPGAHQYDLWFHIAEEITPHLNGDGKSLNLTSSQENGAQITVCCNKGGWSSHDGWISTCYGRKNAAPVFAYSAVDSSIEFFTFIVPCTQNNPVARVSQLKAAGGQAFEVHTGNHIDTLMIRSEKSMETADMVSNFTLSWLRSSQCDAIPTEFLLIGGSRFTVNGTDVVKCEKPVQFLEARRTRETFELRTEQRAWEIGLETTAWKNFS